MPVKFTVCEGGEALSAMSTKALRLPLEEGVNVTLMAQLAPTATLAPHVLVSGKSFLFAPVIEMLLIDRGAVPALVRVMF